MTDLQAADVEYDQKEVVATGFRRNRHRPESIFYYMGFKGLAVLGPKTSV